MSDNQENDSGRNSNGLPALLAILESFYSADKVWVSEIKTRHLKAYSVFNYVSSILVLIPFKPHQ